MVSESAQNKPPLVLMTLQCGLGAGGIKGGRGGEQQGGMEGEADDVPCLFAAVSYGKQQPFSVPLISRTGRMEKIGSCLAALGNR